MKINIIQKKNCNYNKMDKKDVLIVVDEKGNEIGKVISLSNLNLSIGNVSIVIELSELNKKGIK